MMPSSQRHHNANLPAGHEAGKLPAGMVLRDYQWVTSSLAVGSAVAKQDQVSALVADGVSHVLDCRGGESAKALYVGTGIVYKHAPALDDGKPKPDEWFFQGIDFVLGALRWPRAKALVHCKFGMSRAPSMMFAILVAQGISGDEAEARIQNARPAAKVTYRKDAERAGRRWWIRH
ncbi:protein-tyrosine phosphatase family protein [Polyangium jinanense]|uniref:Dual specificity protein phosphatase family protein n=1 Tax=Polyangium jinanense TaxID=2829994 RepID=A0A9X4AWY4_9BACT|nr:hypothetical protein [Polyangium jinanense]MDC3961853.1 dual specificity protein phosphatase family protein [Polyangium jinanense]MDC3987829.1 dual specificity protein phosphatase family protein [Polyangium jinanense]